MPEVLPTTMKAAVLNAPGGPEALQLATRPVPQATPGQVLIRVRAFGINRSELFTRRGESPNVKLPRVLGIEATGTVEAAPGGEFQPGDVVMTCMGGLGRDIDGGYAEFTLVPAAHIQKIDAALADKLGWAILAVWVDDIIPFTKTDTEMKKIYAEVSARFDTKVIGAPQKALGFDFSLFRVNKQIYTEARTLWQRKFAYFVKLSTPWESAVT